jgi:hypothetical protein
MELRGIEPLSEDPSITVSPITVHVLCAMPFPPSNAQRQAFHFSSFIFLSFPQSLGKEVPHLVDAEVLSGEKLKFDSCY